MLIPAAITLTLIGLATCAYAAWSQAEKQPVGRHRPTVAPGRVVDLTGELVLTAPAAQLALEGPKPKPEPEPKRTLKPGWQLDMAVPLAEVEAQLSPQADTQLLIKVPA